MNVWIESFYYHSSRPTVLFTRRWWWWCPCFPNHAFMSIRPRWTQRSLGEGSSFLQRAWFLCRRERERIISIFVFPPWGNKVETKWPESRWFFHPLQILAGPFVKVVLARLAKQTNFMSVELLLYRLIITMSAILLGRSADSAKLDSFLL